ncbi:hypothetical protein GALMADRAFT_59401 [Galerina marginata CBS 339.88]|uniref:Dicer-like protein 1 n=1 Tax=Galerina marginata (strain CBS 339.88) TaxID=685588 RepID=A0A067TFC2_GALM3|nr:hypothetical protein GALMADRAFT_59401 [Galerina marginata CBS 339.88]
MTRENDTLQALDGLVPRRYQEEVFSRAQKGNVIAAMDTGSGKTLISLLLIKWTASLEKSRGKAIVFLVPKVTLVEQQHAYIQKNSSLKIGKFHGAQELDLSDRRGWKRRFEGFDVIVMTAQIFVNLLTHSLWSMEKVSLMIFDECHHARKNHPYNTIMREYVHSPAQSRPKIFGMTASPIWNVRDPLGSLAVLEGNLDAKVTAVREHVDELAVHSPKALEVIKEYPFPPEESNYPFPTIYQCFKVIDNAVWNQLDIPWANIDTRYMVTLNNVGPYCASMFLYLEIQHHLTRIVAENSHNLMEDPDDTGGMHGIMPSSGPSSRELPLEFFPVIDILLDFQSFFPLDLTSHAIPIPIGLDWCTPKVKVLVDILAEYYNHTPTFQCIIFVEQRQVASSLSKVLSVIPELQGKIQSAFLVGQGVNSDGVSKQTDRYRGDPVKLFRDRKINILIATSVAEEGLDFKECDLVVRFDPLHHMVGYVQSRGRARKPGSTFIVMIAQNDTAQLDKYRALQQKEPEVNYVYQTRHMAIDSNDDDDIESDDDTDPVDLLLRDRYVVPSTGATLTYDNSLNLLNYLCSLIPRDAFTLAHKPKYLGDFEATVQLPRALPISAENLTFSGPLRRSKKEARRAVAFMAVKRLRELDVFDEYLLPTSKDSNDDDERVKKNRHGKTKRREIPVMLTVSVRDLWLIGHKLWLHPIVVEGEALAGLVTGTPILPEEAKIGDSRVKTLPAQFIHFDEDLEHEQRSAMHQFTRLGIWYNITSSPFTLPLSLYLIPITHDYEPDFNAIQRLLANPRGISDWSQVSEEDYEELMVISFNRFGSRHLLKRIRDDLSPMSTPPPGSRESDASTYYEYWVKAWSRKNRQAIVPSEGPILQVIQFGIPPSLTVWIQRAGRAGRNPSLQARALLSQYSLLRSWLPISSSIRRAFELLPVLCHRITNAYRARCARHELGLPAIPMNMVTEAFTIPSASMPFNNQRLETLGDAVLQVCTTVQLLNRYPSRHEGQLSNLRQKYVSNQYLLRRALDLGLERFVNTEISSVYKWRYILAESEPIFLDDTSPPTRSVTRQYPRRSLQDCMEAILGAAFLAGGIPLALQTGTALQLEFGGPLPWFMRYHQNTEPTRITPLFVGLEKRLGYKFRYNHLLLESLTHPSFTNSEGPSYQRLEFLGDAILDLVVVKYLFDKYPSATSHQLALPRTKAICAPTLANLAVRRLGLHTMMLANSMDLNIAIDRYVPLLERVSGAEIVKFGWKFDPPKALSDIFESVIGAVLVDSGYNYEKTAAVVEYVMEDVLEALSPAVAKDPVSELTEWAAGSGCRSVFFEKRVKATDLLEREGFAVLVHGNVIVGPIVSSSLNTAKFAAAERALGILRDQSSERSLSHLCDCATTMEVHGPSVLDPLAGFSSLFMDDNDPLDNEDAEEVANILASPPRSYRFTSELNVVIFYLCICSSLENHQFFGIYYLSIFLKNESSPVHRLFVSGKYLSGVHDFSPSIGHLTLSSTFLNSLKSLFPENRALHPGGPVSPILSNPWYIVAAVAFSASNRPEGVPRLFEHLLQDLKVSGSSKKSDEKLLAQKLREALLKSGLISGYPKAINALKALHEVMPDELKETNIQRDPTKSLTEYGVIGNSLWRSVYGENSDAVQGLLDSIYPDMGWFSRTIGYGLVYGHVDTLSALETSYTLVASLIAGDTPQQIAWHLDGARRGGASIEEVQAVRQLSMEVAKFCDVHWQHSVPEVDLSQDQTK